MRKLFLIPILLFALMQTPSLALAQGMMDGWAGLPSSVTSDDHTVREEQEGKEIWEKLQVKELECKNLTDEQYDSLGEYFMGQSIGNTQRHAAMNQMMISMMGEEGERKMHVTLGKRYSGCDPDAQTPSNGLGFMPMMWMMGGGGNPMMGYSGWGGFGWIFMIVFWVLIILGVVALVRYLGRSGQQQEHRTPLDILKERYARGEINKKEFEEKKKDLR
ncbi:MAG TPA: SHOCT domain-containing protein [Candidatus Babeliales bacterium]|nr:SHOCT domain-containing protein [Candidatus Babeliales bacterium]